MLREIHLGRNSRFQREAFDYLKTCYRLREQAEEGSRLVRQETREEESIELSRDANDISRSALKEARDANSIASRAEASARRANAIAKFAIAISAITAIAIAMIQIMGKNF